MGSQFNFIDNKLHGIQCNTARSVNQIETYAKDRAYKDSVDEYENALMDRTNTLKMNVNSQLDDVQSSIFSRRPSPNDPNYARHKEEYKQFLNYADSGLSSMKGLFEQLFAQLINVVKRIVQWILENLPSIVTAIVTIFGKLILPLLGVC